MIFNGILKNVLFRRVNIINKSSLFLNSYKCFCVNNVVSTSELENTLKIELERDQKFVENLSLIDSIKKLKQKNVEAAKEKNSIDNKHADIVYVNGIPLHWNETKVLKYFDKYLTKIRSVKFIVNSYGKSSKNALLHFENPDHAEEFVNKFDEDWINTPDEQFHLKCRIFHLRTNKNKLNIIDRTRQVQQYNLAWEAKEVDIMNIANKFGTIEDFQMPMISKRKNKGYCIITFAKEKFADNFVASIEGLTLFGREIKFKQRFFNINSQKDLPSDNYYDKVITKAETSEIFIRGALEKFGLEHFQKKESVLYSTLASEINAHKLVGPNQYYYVKQNENYQEMAKWRKTKLIKALTIKRENYRQKQLKKIMESDNN